MKIKVIKVNDFENIIDDIVLSESVVFDRDDKLIVHVENISDRMMNNARKGFAKFFEIPEENVLVISTPGELTFAKVTDCFKK
jgi:hypothetical protein